MESNNQNLEQNNQLLLNEESEEISIKVKTIDSNEYLVQTNKDTSISDLKHKIEEVSKVPIERQRLIFRGKQLKDTDTVNTYKISNLDVIHLVAKTTIETHNEITTETDNNTRERGVSRSISSLLNLGRSNGSRGIFDSLNLGELPMEVTNSSRRRRNNRDDNSEYNSIECREAIKQNFSSLQNMQECKNSQIDLDKLETKSEEEKIESFQFSKRKLIVGEWVDVKDTIDQWLEAQVIDIKENKVYIHYNGWGTRWDEWIDMDSERIMPFRFYTKQTTFSNYNSPFPNVKPDANVNVYNQNDSTQQQHQFYDFFNDLNNSFNYCKDIFEKINENREFIKKNKAGFISSCKEEVKKDKSLFNAKNTSSNNFESMMEISDENQTQNKNNNINNSFNYIDKSNNDNLIIIPDIEEESKNIDDNKEESKKIDFEKINKIKQREIFLYSKQVSPLLDRLGRVMTDMGLYMFHNMKNNKLEDLDKELFCNENIDEILKKRDVTNTINLNNNINMNSSTNRSTNLNNLIMDTLLTSQPNNLNTINNNNTNNNILTRLNNANNLNNTSQIQENKNINKDENSNTITDDKLDNEKNVNENKIEETSPKIPNKDTPNSDNANNINNPTIPQTANSATTRNNHSHNHVPLSSGNQRRNNAAQSSSKMEKMLTNQIPCIDTPIVISNNRISHAQPLVDVYVHTIITPLSTEARQSETNSNNPSIFRDPFHLFRRDSESNNQTNINNANPNNNLTTNLENSQENNTSNNNSNNILNSEINLGDIFPSISRASDSLINNRNRNNTNNNRNNITTNNNFENPFDRRSRGPFFGLFTNSGENPDNNNVNNINSQNNNVKSENENKLDKNEINNENKNKVNLDIPSNNNLENKENNNHVRNINRPNNINNIIDPPYLNLNQNNEANSNAEDSQNHLLGKKRKTNISENNTNNVNNSNSSLENNNNDDNFNELNFENHLREDSSQNNLIYSPLGNDLEMIIEEYTEQDDEEDSKVLNESNNYTESENNNNNNNNGNNI